MISLKSGEKKIKRILKRVVYSGKPPIVITKPKEYLDLKNESKILFLRQDRIGDVLVSIPTFKLLKKKFPNLKMDILLGEKNISTKSALNKYFQNIYLYKKDIINILKLIHSLRITNYTAVIDLLAKPSVTSAIFMRFLRAENKIAINNGGNIYTHVINDPDQTARHIVERTAMALKAFGINTDSEILEMEYNLSDEIIRKMKTDAAIDNSKFTLGINLSGSSKSRFWGAQNNIDFINQIADKYGDIEVLIFAVPDYYCIAEMIISRTTKTRLIKTANLDEFAAVISLCDALLSPDTSAVQFSAAFGVPCIALYNNYRHNTGELPWYPYKSEQYSVEGTTNNMEGITVAEVIERFELIYNDYLSSKSKSPNS